MHRGIIRSIVSVMWLSLGMVLTSESQTVSWEADNSIAWDNEFPELGYDIEWTSSLTSEWISSWSHLDGIIETNDLIQKPMPRFFRVVESRRSRMIPEIFTTPTGARNTVLLGNSLTDAPYDPEGKAYAHGLAMAIVAIDTNQNESSSESFVLVKQMEVPGIPISKHEHYIETSCAINSQARCKVCFQYDTGESACVENSTWFSIVTNVNPDVSLPVTNIAIYLKLDNFGFCSGAVVTERNDMLFGYNTNQVSSIVIWIPTITGTVTHTQLDIEELQSCPGSRFWYDLTDGVETARNHALGVKHPTSGLVTNPVSYRLYLSGTNLTTKCPSISSSVLTYWYDED